MSNYVTSSELRDIALIADNIQELDSRLRTGAAEVSLGDITLYDVNGDPLGYLHYDDSVWAFISGEPS